MWPRVASESPGSTTSGNKVNEGRRHEQRGSEAEPVSSFSLSRCQAKEPAVRPSPSGCRAKGLKVRSSPSDYQAKRPVVRSSPFGCRTKELIVGSSPSERQMKGLTVKWDPSGCRARVEGDNGRSEGEQSLRRIWAMSTTSDAVPNDARTRYTKGKKST